MDIVEIRLQPATRLEYVISTEYTRSSETEWKVIDAEEALSFHFSRTAGKVSVYVTTGGQRGDEAKARTTRSVAALDETIRWAAAQDSTDNAGKGIWTRNEQGQEVKVSLHLCPATLVDAHIRNYIGPNTQVNLFNLRREVQDAITITGRQQLGRDYHLMVDLWANLVIPTNRADDIVGKSNAMGSTLAGATSSCKYAAGKGAPLLEHVLHDPDQFKRLVRRQVQEFEDALSHDRELVEMGLENMKAFGEALQDKDISSRNARLSALARKLRPAERLFFVDDEPAEFLLGLYREILDKKLFDVGDTRAAIDAHIQRGEAGILEGVQSVLLSGPLKYSKNRTAAGTHSAATIGNAGLDDNAVIYHRILVFKVGNTAVGGTESTMSGFIRQDAISRVQGRHPQTGQRCSLELETTVKEMINPGEIAAAYEAVHQAFYDAIQKGCSLQQSRVYVKTLECEMSLAEAHSLFSAITFGERGETSGRVRTWRMQDLVETGFVYRVERHSKEVLNAVDRGTKMKKMGLITGYRVTGDYPGYSTGDTILPGMRLHQEHLTTRECVPIIDIFNSWPALNVSGSNDLTPGDSLDPQLTKYLQAAFYHRNVIALGTHPGAEGLHYIRKITPG